MLASLFNPKARKWVQGRRSWQKKIKGPGEGSGKKVYWFHASSLGEYEMCKPLIKEIKSRNGNSYVFVTFFSPSGFEGIADKELADQFAYLPMEGPSNAKEFVRILDPDFAFFAKYDLWYFFIQALQLKKTPIVLFSASFRKGQFYFSPFGKFFLKRIRLIDHIFVQDQASKDLLDSYGINSEISGDSRFERVAQISESSPDFPEIKNFIGDSNCIVGGSLWPSDIENSGLDRLNLGDWKLILAPHDISEASLNYFEKKFQGTIRYSALGEISNTSILLIDNIGMLSRLYGLADFAFVGGGFKEGLHNILEPAAWSLPVAFGPQIQKFPEAQALVDVGGGFLLSNVQDLENAFSKIEDPEFRKDAGSRSRKFIESGSRSTQIILSRIKAV